MSNYISRDFYEDIINYLNPYLFLDKRLLKAITLSEFNKLYMHIEDLRKKKILDMIKTYCHENNLMKLFEIRKVIKGGIEYKHFGQNNIEQFLYHRYRSKFFSYRLTYSGSNNSDQSLYIYFYLYFDNDRQKIVSHSIEYLDTPVLPIKVKNLEDITDIEFIYK